MILFELRCSNDHHFEAWFRDGASYDHQAQAGDIVCPVCGDRKVGKAIMAPRIAKTSPRDAQAQDQALALHRVLMDLRRQVEDNCTYVGEEFPEQARKIHYGEADPAPIYGEASPQQVEELQEEGIAVQPIPWVTAKN